MVILCMTGRKEKGFELKPPDMTDMRVGDSLFLQEDCPDTLLYKLKN